MDISVVYKKLYFFFGSLVLRFMGSHGGKLGRWDAGRRLRRRGEWLGRPDRRRNVKMVHKCTPTIVLGLIGSTIQVRIASGSGLLVISPYPQEVMAAYTVHVGPTGGTYDIFANGQQVQLSSCTYFFN